MEHSELLLQFLVLLGATTLFATLFHHLKIPTIVGFITSGIVVGPFGFGLVSSVPGAEALTEIGVIFLMFTIGLEFSFSKLKYLKKAFLGLGMVQVVGTLLFSTLIAKWTGLDWSHSIVLGFLPSLSSTAIVMKLLEDSRELATPYGSATLGILLFQDLAVIPMMLALPLLGASTQVQVGVDLNDTLAWLAKISGFVGSIWLLAKYVIPFVLEQVVRTRSRELFFFSMLLLCFGVAYMMELSGLSLSFGAFLAGIMISESPYGRQATSDIVPLRNNFLGLFFASVGMLVDLKFMIVNLHWILLIVLAVAAIKSGIVFVASKLLKYPFATALMTSLMVFQIGEFSFVIAKRGVADGLISTENFQMFMAVSVMTMMLTPFVYRLAPYLSMRFGRNSMKTISGSKIGAASEAESAAPHTIIIGFGVAGQNLASALASLNIPYKVIEQNYESVQKLKKMGEPILYGDASRAEVLEQAGIETARLVVIAASGGHMIRVIVDEVKKIRPDVNLIIRTQYSREKEEFESVENAHVVVAEYETTIELLAQSLMTYGVTYDEIGGLMAQTRKRLKGTEFGPSDFLRRSVDIPGWQTLNAIKPLIVKSHYAAIGKSIKDLDIRKQAGVTIVAVYREGDGISVPSGDYVLQPADVLQVIGDASSILRAKTILSGSADTSSFTKL